MLHPTPRDKLVDAKGRPYFLWDVDMTLEEFEAALYDRKSADRPYLIGKLMRQAKPDDVFEFVSLGEIVDLWPQLERYLGEKRPFWEWLLRRWQEMGHGRPRG